MPEGVDLPERGELGLVVGREVLALDALPVEGPLPPLSAMACIAGERDAGDGVPDACLLLPAEAEREAGFWRCLD